MSWWGGPCTVPTALGWSTENDGGDKTSPEFSLGWSSSLQKSPPMYFWGPATEGQNAGGWESGGWWDNPSLVSSTLPRQKEGPQGGTEQVTPSGPRRGRKIFRFGEIQPGLWVPTRLQEGMEEPCSVPPPHAWIAPMGRGGQPKFNHNTALRGKNKQVPKRPAVAAGTVRAQAVTSSSPRTPQSGP